MTNLTPSMGGVCVDAVGSSIPVWNDEDLRLIATGRASISNCSAADQAKVFLANKILSTWSRVQTGHLKTSGVSALKLRGRLALQGRQVFGNRCLAWNISKLVSQTEHFLVEASSKGVPVEVSLTTDRYKRLLQEGGCWIEIKDIARDLQNLGATLVLQGSCSDGTTTPFSDIDLVLFGNPDNHDQHQLKKRLDETVLAADPLQHHGVFFYDRKLLSRYPESVLPLETFRKATAIAESVDLDFHILNDKYSPAATLVPLVRKLKAFLKDPSSIRGMWDWKFKVSQFALIPTLLAAVRGQYLYKGDSFRYAAQLYSSPAWAAMEALTRVRRLWSLPISGTSDASSDSYLCDLNRSLGRLDHDPWPVVDQLAIWKQPEFCVAADSFLDQTMQLAGLA